jgi:hypothetical protein
VVAVTAVQATVPATVASTAASPVTLPKIAAPQDAKIEADAVTAAPAAAIPQKSNATTVAISATLPGPVQSRSKSAVPAAATGAHQSVQMTTKNAIIVKDTVISRATAPSPARMTPEAVADPRVAPDPDHPVPGPGTGVVVTGDVAGQALAPDPLAPDPEAEIPAEELALKRDEVMTTDVGKAPQVPLPSQDQRKEVSVAILETTREASQKAPMDQSRINREDFFVSLFCVGLCGN